MPMKKYKPEQIVTLLRTESGGRPAGKACPQFPERERRPRRRARLCHLWTEK
jgi:hypothetical protein